MAIIITKRPSNWPKTRPIVWVSDEPSDEEPMCLYAYDHVSYIGSNDISDLLPISSETVSRFIIFVDEKKVHNRMTSSTDAYENILQLLEKISV